MAWICQVGERGGDWEGLAQAKAHRAHGWGWGKELPGI